MSVRIPRGVVGSVKRFTQDTSLSRYRQTLISGGGGYTTVVTGGTANAYGSWAQVTSSLGGNGGLMFINFGNNNSNSVDASTLLDIGVGAAGSEVAVVPTVAIGGTSQNFAWIPVSIASGARVAIRAQSARTSFTFYPQVWFFKTNDYALTPTTLDAIGISSSTSQGTAMSGASGTYVQLTASTAKDYQQILMVASAATSTGASGAVTYTLATGAAGSEVDVGTLYANYVTNTVGPQSAANPGGVPCGAPIPAGTRLSVKHNIASNPGKYSVCLLGVPYV